LRGFPGLGHLPLRRTGLTAQVGKEAFDVLASEVPAAAGSLAAVEELPHLQGIETPTALRHAEFLQDLEVALSGATR
jgi:hypothetical protein